MMDFHIESCDLSLVDTGDNLLQSGFWGTFKSETEVDAQAFQISCDAGSFSLLTVIRETAGGWLYAYVPHGPDIYLPEDSHGRFLEALSSALSPHIPAECAFLRYDIPWKSPYDDSDFYDETGLWKGPPEPQVREMRMNFGSSEWNLRKAATDIQPPDTVLIDLRHGDEAILKRMRQNTRNCIRRAFRKGLVTYQAPAEELRRWYELYRRTAERKGFRPQEFEYFSRLFHIAKESDENAPDLHLIQAEADGTLAGGVILAFSGNRAYYLYAATQPESREYMPAYGLQWKAIETARAAGCTEYDLYGIPPNRDRSHPMHGLYTFKTGFGGKILHRRGCWDYPIHSEAYEQVKGVEAAMGGYHL